MRTLKFIKARDKFLEFQARMNLINMNQVDINKLRLLALNATVLASDWRDMNIINSMVDQSLGAKS